MVKFENSTHISRPLAEVFKYMVDPTKLPEWNSIVEEASTSETPIRVGTRIQQRARFLGRKIDGTFEVTEHELNKRYAFKTEKPFPFTLTNTFEPDGDGTNVVTVEEPYPAELFKTATQLPTRIANNTLSAHPA